MNFRRIIQEESPAPYASGCFTNSAQIRGQVYIFESMVFSNFPVVATVGSKGGYLSLLSYKVNYLDLALVRWPSRVTQQADRLDPLVESPPSILDEKDEIEFPS